VANESGEPAAHFDLDRIANRRWLDDDGGDQFAQRDDGLPVSVRLSDDRTF
jgi:hypothetical protein